MESNELKQQFSDTKNLPVIVRVNGKDYDIGRAFVATDGILGPHVVLVAQELDL